MVAVMAACWEGRGTRCPARDAGRPARIRNGLGCWKTMHPPIPRIRAMVKAAASALQRLARVFSTASDATRRWPPSRAGWTVGGRASRAAGLLRCPAARLARMSQPPGATAARVSALPAQIDELWERCGELDQADTAARSVVTAAVDALDSGVARVAAVDPSTGQVVVDERAKRAILLSFRLLPMVRSQVGDFHHHDRIPLKTRLDGVRVVPGAVIRWGAYVAPGVVLMPSFTNIGAYVDAGTMVDTWATVGSCAQIGRNVHLSAGAGIGGRLDPPNAVPVVGADER